MAAQRIDDRDSSVAYSRNHWSNQGSSTSYGNTLRLTRTRGATARLTFQGTTIAVYGLISPSGVGDPPQSTYSVDNGPTMPFNATMQSSTQSQVLFYYSGSLSPGTHTLVVTNEKESSFLWLDSFLITPNPDTVVTITTVISNGPENPPESKTVTATDSPGSSPQTLVLTETISTNTVSNGLTRVYVSTREFTSTGPASASASTRNGHVDSQDISTAKPSSPSIAAIIGGVLGSLLVIALVILVLFFCKWKKARTAAPSSGFGQYSYRVPDGASSATITPFGVTSTMTGSTHYPQLVMAQMDGAPLSGWYNPGQFYHHPIQNSSMPVSNETGTQRGTEKTQRRHRMAMGGNLSDAAERQVHPLHHRPQISLTTSEALSGTGTTDLTRNTGYGGGLTIPNHSPPAYQAVPNSVVGRSVG